MYVGTTQMSMGAIRAESLTECARAAGAGSRELVVFIVFEFCVANRSDFRPGRLCRRLTFTKLARL